MLGRQPTVAILASWILCAALHAQVLDHVRYRRPADDARPGSIAQAVSHVAQRVETAPQLDGELDDACWRGPDAYLGSFRLGLSPTPARHAREAWAAYDDEHLYFAVKLEREPGSELRAICAEPDSVQLWKDDEFEIFLDPFGSGATYYQLIVNSAGVLYDAVHTYRIVPDPRGASPTDTRRERVTDLTWSAGVRLGRAVHRQDWTVELALPLESMGLAGAPAGHDVRLNITSADWDTGEYTCLSPVSDWHDPAQLGSLRLGRQLVQVERLDIGPVGLGRCGLRARIRHVSGQSGEYVLRLTLHVGEGEAASERKFALAAGRVESVRLTFRVEAGTGPWQADITIADASGRAVFAGRRGGTVPAPLTVRLGSRAVFSDGRPVLLAARLGVGDVTARRVTLSARLVDAQGRTLREQDLGSPDTAHMAANLPVEGLSAGTYRVQLLARDAGELVATAEDTLRVGESPFAGR